MPENRQTLLFSATLPKALAEFARAGLREPTLIRLDADTKLSPDLRMGFITVPADAKPAALLYLLREAVPTGQQTVVFASTRHHAEFLTMLLRADGMDPCVVYGAMDQAARKIQVAKFRAGRGAVLMTTDVAARGIDLPLLDNVINYDFPPRPKLFVHRVGRVARAGRPGAALSLVSRDEMGFLLDLHLFLSRPLRPAAAGDGPGGGLADGEQVGDGLSAVTDPAGSVFGGFPQALLDSEVERVRAIVEPDADLVSQLRVTHNAYKMYLKTRPPAAPESNARGRTMALTAVHPLLARTALAIAAQVSAPSLLAISCPCSDQPHYLACRHQSNAATCFPLRFLEFSPRRRDCRR